MNSRLSQLRHSRVFRLAALYLAVAWLMLQVVDLVLEAFEAPASVLRLPLIALAIGFPLFLLSAWLHEVALERRGREAALADAGSGSGFIRWANPAIAVSLLLALLLALPPLLPGQKSAERDAALPDTGTSTPTIAVLPLANISRDPTDQFFANGLTEELVSVLASVPQLNVVAASSTFHFPGPLTDARDVGEQLGADHLLTGSARIDGEQLRVAIQLVVTETGDTLWSAVYDRGLQDMFAIQSEIAARVSGTLQLSLLNDVVPILRATSPEAFIAYLKALHQYRRYSAAGYAQAADQLREVLALDEGYAPAWTLLSSVLQNQAAIGAIDFHDGHEQAREAIERALAIDPNYAYAVSSRGWLAKAYDRDYRAAARYFSRALELAPREPAILGNAGTLAMNLGRAERALELTRRGLKYDPMATSAHNNLSDQLYQARRFVEAIGPAERALVLSPENVIARVNLGAAKLLAGDAEAALQLADGLKPGFYGLFISALSAHDLGRSAEAGASLGELIEQYPTRRAAYIAAIYAFRGDTENAFAWLQRAIDERQRGMNMRTEPLFDSLRDDPRWPRVLEAFGVSDAQVSPIDI